MTISTSQVATEDDVAEELGGAGVLDNLVSETFTIERVLELSLADVLYELANRTPPVAESDITTPSQLKRAVVECAIARLFCNGITTPDGLHATKHKIYRKRYESTVESLRPTVAGGYATAAPFGIALHRR
jgi:hypothetical protein